MKLKPLLDKALIYFVSALLICLLLILIAQAISLAFYVLIFMSAIGVLVYLYLRKNKCFKQ